jgi:hypothetical protein
MPGGVRGVHQQGDVVFAGGGGDGAYREGFCRWGGQLIDDHELGPARPQCVAQPGHDLAVRRAQRHGHGPGGRTGPAALPADGERHGAVGVIGEQHLVARSEPHRLQHQRHARGGVGDQCAAVRIGAEEGRQMPPGVDDPVVQPLGEVLHRV